MKIVLTRFLTRYVNGEVQLNVTDLSAGGFGGMWRQQRVYSNQLPHDHDYGSGFNWLVRQWPYLIENTGGSIVFVQSTRDALNRSQGSGLVDLNMDRDDDFDTFGRLQRLDVQDGNGHLVSSDEYEYAADGVITASLDGLGVRTELVHDKSGLLVGTLAAVGASYPAAVTGSSLDIEERTTYSYYANGSANTPAALADCAQKSKVFAKRFPQPC
ncbi:MAG: hypothetical protein ABI614_27620 [Planctomycetota bacterium]